MPFVSRLDPSFVRRSDLAREMRLPHASYIINLLGKSLPPDIPHPLFGYRGWWLRTLAAFYGEQPQLLDQAATRLARSGFFTAREVRQKLVTLFQLDTLLPSVETAETVPTEAERQEGVSANNNLVKIDDILGTAVSRALDAGVREFASVLHKEIASLPRNNSESGAP